nr:hypothetical protein [Tanacetum cinerariifolium]
CPACRPGRRCRPSWHPPPGCPPRPRRSTRCSRKPPGGAWPAPLAYGELRVGHGRGAVVDQLKERAHLVIGEFAKVAGLVEGAHDGRRVDDGDAHRKRAVGVDYQRAVGGPGGEGGLQVGAEVVSQHVAGERHALLRNVGVGHGGGGHAHHKVAAGGGRACARGHGNEARSGARRHHCREAGRRVHHKRTGRRAIEAHGRGSGQVGTRNRNAGASHPGGRAQQRYRGRRVENGNADGSRAAAKQR